MRGSDFRWKLEDPTNGKITTNERRMRAVIIEELNFLNWDFFFPGFPEKHAGIIIEGGADLPFPPRFLKIG